MKVLVAEKIAQQGIDVLIAENLQVDVKMDLSREELLNVIEEYDAIIVRSVTKVNEEFYKRAKNLRVVGRAGNGVDNIDMEGATKRGIIVVNTPEANTVSAAEHTIGLLLSSIRNIAQANNRIKSRVWDRSNLKGVELQGKTLGVVGLGRIGSLVAVRMQSFGMKVIAYDPYITDARFKKFGVEKKEKLEDLVQESDFITVHTPKTDETFGMIGDEEFKVAKKGVRVVNCARGGIINEEALVKAIKEGIVASAGIDVLVNEPNTTSPLLDLDNVVLTPHLGADTEEAQYNVGVTVAHEVVSALEGDMVPNAVNLPTLHKNELDAIKAYLRLGETLGKLYHQLEKDPVEKVEIVYSGEIANMETTTVTLGVLKGLFETILKERVNYVNASLIAKNRGVDVVESKETSEGKYLNLIQVKISSKYKTFTLAGTVFGKDDLRIVEVNGYEFDVAPSPCMLVAMNLDKPGMIGQIGTLLGVSKINIATMQVSRKNGAEWAMMFLTVDSEVSKESLKLIGGLEGISNVQFIRL
ncbi:phosphoglycerate dehydrogenase [Candidatus Formimonas warabiya]|uniref:D-3-phosphoglycerate dehydrogenase n=1 Tax=Formimonas warabiya TaxID=1761012 RepID=A0A3G1KPE6_FORW1|nr:phosphoglycerate dehydrogenase [Candidatus Formimonas warabiya]ATW24318.1 phosphoglycerate dehydrogenase [Candidatus Formimonas warabiya]